jgi:poly-gamma-glutamate synthesis protein (capsule biosynthesis protein)
MEHGANTITLFLCGDVMTGRGIDQVLPHPSDPALREFYVRDARDYVALAEEAHGKIQRPVDFAYVWGEALDELGRVGPDVRIILLETSVTTSEDWEDKGINYRMHPANIPCLAALKPDVCVLANNHVLDFRRRGLEETLTVLKQAGMRTAGAGRNLAEAQAPAIVEVPGKGRVLVFGFADENCGVPASWAASKKQSGVHLLRDLSDAAVDAFAVRLRALRMPRDIVVASIHWGGNWGYEVPVAQRAFAHALIDRADVDVVHGHSSHHAKGIEVYRDRLVLYGCGDFLNDYEGIRGYESYRDDLSFMYFPTLSPASGRLEALRLVPTRIRNFRLNRADKQDTEWLQAMLNREGRAFGTGAELLADGSLRLVWH